MQSVLLYGRLLARALATGINNEFHHQLTLKDAPQSTLAGRASLRLQTAFSGFSKSQSPSQVSNKWSFGDDACFIASHKSGEVLGEKECKSARFPGVKMTFA